MRDILNKWKCEFEHLYTFTLEKGDFDDIFYTQMLREKNRLEETGDCLNGLNHSISESEVHLSVFNSKNNKDVGIDNLPNEIF